MSKKVYVIEADDLLPLGGGLFLVDGTLLPAAADVKSGVKYGPREALTGELAAGEADYPAEADVRDGTDFDDGGKTGTLDLPAVSDVKAGVKFDGEAKTGTLAVRNPATGFRSDDVTSLIAVSWISPTWLYGSFDLSDFTNLYNLEIVYADYVSGTLRLPSGLGQLTLYTVAWTSLDLANCPLLETVSITSATLHSVTLPISNSALTSWHCINVGGDWNAPDLTQYTANLTSVWFQSCGIVSLDVSGLMLVELDASLDVDLTTVDITGCEYLQVVYCGGSALTQTSVDALLVELAANGLTSGTCCLDGGTNAAPGSAGLAAIDILETNLWYVTYNT